MGLQGGHLGGRVQNSRSGALCPRGSALILVLWFLALMGFLVHTYLVQNRAKAVVTFQGLKTLREEQAVASVTALFLVSSAHILRGQEGSDTGWFPLDIGGIRVLVRAEDEAGKVDLNSGTDFDIRNAILEAFGDERADEAEEVADSILDWRDEDVLTRTHGAEKDFYQAKGLPGPADGPFKVLTELLLVRGVSREIFWGDPMGQALLGSGDEEASDLLREKTPIALYDIFTIYKKDVKRLAIVVPGTGRGYLFVLLFFKRQGDGKLIPLQKYETFMVSKINRDPQGHLI